MARVPFQQNLNQEVAAGSEVQFGATSVEPMKDVVTDDIERQGRALTQAGQTIQKLDDELNDAEAKRLYNESHYEVERVANEYTQLQGVEAVKTLQTEGEGEEQITVLDDYNNNKLKTILENGSSQASNGVVKYMYEQMMSTSIKSAQNKMITHSLKQQRNYLENETNESIDIFKSKAMNNYKDWRDPTGEFNKNRYAAHEELKKYAVLKGWNLDPNAVNAKGEKIGISKQYLKMRSELDLEIAKDVIKKLNEDKDTVGVKEFKESLKPFTNEKTYNEISSGIEQKHENFKGENCVNAVLTHNGNQNNGDFLTQTNKLMCLKTNHAYDDGKGAVVTDGFHSDQVDTTEKKNTENIETLQQLRDTSKFYSVDSAQAGTLIPEHQTTHLYAIQRLGVKKADSLYTKAKSEIDIDKTKYKEDSVYANKINKKILDNYNKLIIEESNKIYGRFGEGDYAIAIANDLEIIKKGVDYNYKNTNEDVEVNFITGLRPLNDLKEEIKETITDKDTQEHALKDLEVKYTEIYNQKTQIYNQNLNNAKRIAFATPNGWKNLAANNIEIENFSKEDQEILKKGQPTESNKDVVIDLERNPLEVKDNLLAYSHQLSPSDYLEFERYAKSLNSDAKVLNATGNSDMFDASLIRFGYTDIVSKVTDDPKAKDQYNFKFDYKQIKDAWLTRIDKEQTETGKTLTRTRKQELLDEILADGVITKRWGFFRKSDITIPSVALEADQFKDAFVFVGSEKVFTYNIPKDVREYFIAGYEAAGMPYTEQMIANEYVLHGKKKSKAEIIKFKEENNL
mgnify:FL=1|jgi:hypothetical protein|tara:strand:- start:5525 stop:7912 length:2388 start_codon:yes stop_codon:yes gene_type:complete